MRTQVFGGAGDRAIVPNIGILVSDGHSTIDPERTLSEATLAKANNITMLSVVVSDDHNLNDMTAIASNPRTDLFLLISSSNLHSVVARVVDRLLDVVIW